MQDEEKDHLAKIIEGLNERLAKAEGKAEGTLEIAKNMLAKGFSLETVQEVTGLPLVEIQALMANKSSVKEPPAPYGRRPRKPKT